MSSGSAGLPAGCSEDLQVLSRHRVHHPSKTLSWVGGIPRTPPQVVTNPTAAAPCWGCACHRAARALVPVARLQSAMPSMQFAEPPAEVREAEQLVAASQARAPVQVVRAPLSAWA